MKNEHVSKFIDDYVDGELDGETLRMVEEHLVSCESCRAEVAEVRQLTAKLKALPLEIEPPAAVGGKQPWEPEEPTVRGNIFAFRENGTPDHDPAVTKGRIALGSRLTPFVGRAAAIAALVIVGGAAWYLFQGHPEEQRQPNLASKVETGKRNDGVGIEAPAAPPPQTTTNRREGAPPAADVQKRVPNADGKVTSGRRTTTPEATNGGLGSEVALTQRPATETKSGEDARVTDITMEKDRPSQVRPTDAGAPAATVATDEALVAPQNRTNAEAPPAIELNAAPSGHQAYTPPAEPDKTRGEELLKASRRRTAQQQSVSKKLGRFSYSWQDDATKVDAESYDRIYENRFHDAQDEPKSTFSIDVDAASYSNVRRFLNDGVLPPVDAVRIEEMVNYFSYSYPLPERDRPLSVTGEVARCPWNSRNLLLMVGLRGREVDPEDLPASNLVFLIDVSGSMRPENKLPLLRDAFRVLVDRLRPEDRVSIVVYAGRAGLVLPPTRGDRKRTILNAIDALEAGGSTAGGEGIRLAYSQARDAFIEGGNNRVILATDGDFNVGVSSDEEMVELIEKERGDGIFLSVLGVGTGNLKDSKMEKIADKGNGTYYYLDGMREARKVFGRQLSGTLYTIAKDVKVQMEFDPEVVESYRLVGYENRVMANRDFRDDRKDAGELGSGHTVTAFYEIVPVEDDRRENEDVAMEGRRGRDSRYTDLATVAIRYKNPEGTRAKEFSVGVLDDRPEIEDASDNLRFAAAVAEFGMMLRDSQHRGTATYRQVLRLAEGAMGSDPGGYRAEFVRLVRQSEDLVGRD